MPKQAQFMSSTLESRRKRAIKYATTLEIAKLIEDNEHSLITAVINRFDRKGITITSEEVRIGIIEVFETIGL